jgi:hypothetical protein
MDYAMLGLQVWAVTREAWLPMSRAYRALRSILDEHGAGAAEDGPLAALRVHIQADWDMMQMGRIALDSEREVHHTVFRDAYEHAWRGLAAPVGPATFAERIAPLPASAVHRAATADLRRILLTQTAGAIANHAAFVEKVVAVLARYLREEQAILAAATELEREIDRRLARPGPTRPLTVRDIRLYYTMRRGKIATWPYIFDTFEEVFGLHVESTIDVIHVSDRPSRHACHDTPLQRPDVHAS